MRSVSFLIFTFLITAQAQSADLTINEYRENLLNSPSGVRIGTISQGARLKKLDEKGEWVKVSLEGWLWKGSIRPFAATASQSSAQSTANAPRADKVLIPSLLKKGFVDEKLNEMVWLDVKFDTHNLPKKTRAIKGALVISDLFDEVIMRIFWTINKPLTPGEEYVEKGTNFAYNDFLGHHQWVRFTEAEDMKLSFEVRNIIYEDGERQAFYR